MNKKSKLQMIQVEKLHPHPDNPRKVIGDVSELAESIKANGILQNLTVVPNNDNWDDFTVIIGHRRLAAAKQAGLTELPCAVVEMTEKEQLSTMLTENMQRSDLTVYEQAKGFQMLIDLGDSVAEVVEKTGFKESTVRRRLKLAELDEEFFKDSQLRQPTLADYERLNQIKNIDARNELLKSIGTNNFDNLLYSAVKKQETDEEKEKIEKLCLEHGMIKAQKHDEIPSNYEYTGFFVLKDLIGKDFADGRKRYFYFGYGSNIYIYAEAFEKQEKNDAEEEKRKLEEQRWDELVEQAEETDERCEALRIGFMLDTNFNDSNDAQRDKIRFTISQTKPLIDVEDCSADETPAEMWDISIIYDGKVMLPISTAEGLMFIDRVYLNPFADMPNETMALALRKDIKGTPYFAVKFGMITYSFICAYEIVDEDFVRQLKSLYIESDMILKNKKG